MLRRTRLRVAADQEITLHTPASEWYTETADNPLAYWGLDYPPLSAFQSWLCGAVLRALEPAAVALSTSRGYETASSKAALRASVLLFDAVLLFPAVAAAARAALAPRGSAPAGLRASRAAAVQRASAGVWALAAVLLQPALILIDHGHFQVRVLHAPVLSPA